MKKISRQKILAKVVKSKLVGRGGSGYSTADKWTRMTDKNPELMYMVVNGSEGEPLTKKDEYILENRLDQLMRGVAYGYKLFPQTKTIYIYLRKDFFGKYKVKIEHLAKEFELPVVVFKEPGGYLCGENTTLINTIEGKRWEPRGKPPYCSDFGIWGKPTLVNNIETFFRVGEIVEGNYKNSRFYTISGEVKYPGVYDKSCEISLTELLSETKNLLTQNNFMQIGGGASGLYYASYEISKCLPNTGTGAVAVYDSKKITFEQLMKSKLEFLLKENCGKCIPCREGVYRLDELVRKDEINIKMIKKICLAMAKTSFCGLGIGAGESLLSLVLKKDNIWR
jgi:NADH:ubiquinone oxidoreductase subunit F (NADH-binding)